MKCLIFHRGSKCVKYSGTCSKFLFRYITRSSFYCSGQKPKQKAGKTIKELLYHWKCQGVDQALGSWKGMYCNSGIFWFCVLSRVGFLCRWIFHMATKGCSILGIASATWLCIHASIHLGAPKTVLCPEYCKEVLGLCLSRLNLVTC